jgi:hypothetical protein
MIDRGAFLVGGAAAADRLYTHPEQAAEETLLFRRLLKEFRFKATYPSSDGDAARWEA